MTQEQRSITELEHIAEYHARMAESCRHYRRNVLHPHLSESMKAHQDKRDYYAAQVFGYYAEQV